MNEASTRSGIQDILERKHAELMGGLRNRDGIAIEKSADQMDEIQYATERDLAIRNVDRESTLLRQVKAALRRIHDGSIRNMRRLRRDHQPKAPRRRALGDALYSMPGNCRPRGTGDRGC